MKNFKFIIKMALRNISRNRRRTALSIIAIMLAVLFVCFIRSYIAGMSSDIQRNIFMFETAHIKLMNKNYLKEEKLMPLDLNIYGFEKNYSELIDMIKSVDGVKYVFPRTKFAAMLNLKGKMKNIIGFALNPELEAPVNPLSEKIISGRMFKEYSPGVHELVIGKALSDELGVKVGDKLTMMTKTAEEGLGIMTFRIAGIVSYGVPQFDKMFFYIPFSVAARFLKMESEVIELAIYLDKPKDSILIAKKINQILKTKPENPYQAYPWEYQNNGQYFKMIEMMTNVYNIVYVIFLVLASLVIINTTMMVIYERMKEIGTLAALGMRGYSIVQLFFYEAVIISIIGSFIGTVSGGILSFVASKSGINLAKLSGGGVSLQFSEMMYPYFGLNLLIFSFVFGVLVASLCSFIPASRAARIEPVEAMRGVF